MTIFTDKRSFVMDVTIVSLDMATDVMSDFPSFYFSAYKY